MRDKILLPATSATGGRVEIIIYRPPTDTPRPALLLHGAKDDRAHIDQARAFHERLVALGRSSRMVIYPEAKHGLPQGHIRGEVIPYLKEMLE